MASASNINNTATYKNISRSEIKMVYDGISTDANIKRVFSTNVFIPMTPNITDKTLMYYTGFIKLVETFKIRTGFDRLPPDEKWYLYIYVDDMFYRNYEDVKYIESPQNNGNNRNNRNNSNNRSNNRNNRNNRNNYINTSIKQTYNKNKYNLLKIHQLYKLYIEYITSHKDEYNFIRLYSFDFPDVIKKNKGYLGHPETLGSIVRAEPLYDTTIDYVFLINISHAITPKIMELIGDWILSGKTIILHSLYRGGLMVRSYKGIEYFRIHNKDKHIEFADKFKIAAGLFGYKRNSEKPMEYIDYNYKEFIKTDAPLFYYSYGFDEAVLMTIFKDLTRFTKDKDNKNSKVL